MGWIIQSFVGTGRNGDRVFHTQIFSTNAVCAVTDADINYIPTHGLQLSSAELTSGSSVSRSLILLPLRFKFVNFGQPCKNCRPLDILLSLSSNCNNRTNTFHHMYQLPVTRSISQILQLACMIFTKGSWLSLKIMTYFHQDLDIMENVAKISLQK